MATFVFQWNYQLWSSATFRGMQHCQYYPSLTGGIMPWLLVRVVLVVCPLECDYSEVIWWRHHLNGNIFRVTGHLCGEFTGPRWIPRTKPVARSFHVFFDLHLNKRLSKQSWGWWFETLSHPLWRHCNASLVQMIAWGPNTDDKQWWPSSATPVCGIMGRWVSNYIMDGRAFVVAKGVFIMETVVFWHCDNG